MANIVFVQTPLKINTSTYIVFVELIWVNNVNMWHKKSSTTVEDFVNWLGLEPRTHTLKVYCSTNWATNSSVPFFRWECKNKAKMFLDKFIFKTFLSKYVICLSAQCLWALQLKMILKYLNLKVFYSHKIINPHPLISLLSNLPEISNLLLL